MPTVPTSWQKQEAEKLDEDEGGEREEEQEEEGGGVVPLIKFRDPHLAGWENMGKSHWKLHGKHSLSWM